MRSHDPYEEVRAGVRALCAQFPDEYFRKVDHERGYPTEFVDALTHAGWLAALIPQEYGGSGLSLAEASVIMEEINRSGGNSGACHGQMYVMNVLVRHGNERQKQEYLTKIASGELRLQSMAVTEPTTGTDTTKLKTTAVRRGDRYVVNGQKVWISRVRNSDLMLLLARTTPLESCRKRVDGLSVFIVDIREGLGHGLAIRPLQAMFNHNTTEVFFDGLRVPAKNLIGEEGNGFAYILAGLNAERTLIAAEAVGDGRYFIDRAVSYANQRIVFDRSIARNQGVQFPLARAHAELEAADVMVRRAAALFDAGQPCGADANIAKLLASEACWRAAEAAVQTFGGFAFAREYDIERKWRECRVYQVAPISTNLILAHVAQHVLGLERSY
jgi:acyl-CoA dehydrogenase